MEQVTPVVSEITPQEIHEEWVEWLKETKKSSPNTVRLYSRIVLEAIRDIPELGDATPEGLERWVQNKGGAASSFSNRCSALTSYFRFMVKYKYRTDNPAVEIERPKRPKRVPKPVVNIEGVLQELDEQDRLANAMGPIQRRVGETRDMALFLYYTGLRIHEAVKRREDPWPMPCPEEMTIIGKGDKEEVIQLRQEAREVSDRLNGRWPVGARATQRRFEKVAHIERVTPHKWRHTLATTLVRQGIEIGRVSKILRHASPQTTMGYAAYAAKENREALSVLPTY